MILDHVSQCSGFLIVSATAFDANRFCRSDLHIVYVTPIPQRFKYSIPEPKGQNVLYRLFAQVMIDPVDVGFFKDLMEFFTELSGTGQIMPKGFLHDDAPPPAARCQVRLPYPFHHSRVLARLGRKIKQYISARMS